MGVSFDLFFPWMNTGCDCFRKMFAISDFRSVAIHRAAPRLQDHSGASRFQVGSSACRRNPSRGVLWGYRKNRHPSQEFRNACGTDPAQSGG